MDYFKELYNVLPADNFETLVQHRSQRIKQAIATNPYYFNGPFTGIAIAAGANSFVFRLAANCSKEYPQGYLSKETFASFWGVKGKGKNMYWEPGHDVSRSFQRHRRQVTDGITAYPRELVPPSLRR